MLNEQQKMEVKKAYRDAKGKPEQIRILAQLYGTTTCEIRHILYDAGVYPIDAEVIRRIDLYLNKKGASFGSIRNWIHIMSDYGATDVRELIADWNTHPWGMDKFVVSVPLEQKGRRVKIALTNPSVKVEEKAAPEIKAEPTPKQEEPKHVPIMAKPIEKPVESVNQPIDDTTRYVYAAIKDRVITLTERRDAINAELKEVLAEIEALKVFALKLKNGGVTNGN